MYGGVCARIIERQCLVCPAVCRSGDNLFDNHRGRFSRLDEAKGGGRFTSLAESSGKAVENDAGKRRYAQSFGLGINKGHCTTRAESLGPGFAFP